MSDRSTKRESGFSLLEMMIAMALGLVVLGAAVQIYIQGVSATWKVTQRSEMQQDFRAAANILIKDLSLAGAGLGNGAAIALPSATTPVYGCDQSGACYINGGSVNYPTQGGTPYLYGLIPGLNAGPTPTSSPAGHTDTVTVAYTDTAFYLNCYTATVTAKGVVTFAPAASPTPWPTPGCLPTGVATPQAPNDGVVGLTPGDLVLMTLNGTQMVVEVTGAVTSLGSNQYTVPFANNDALHMNQTSGAINYLNSVPNNATGTAPVRILVVTYYIDNSTTPSRLMRQVSGHTPMPVTENVVYLKFSYDLFNSATNAPVVNQTDGGVSAGLLPNQITKINILNMAMDSSVKGAQGGYQSVNLQTSVSARNLTYNNNYPQ
jgi:prepilin-type N-terminal cleavage/methylation domain-containing protein